MIQPSLTRDTENTRVHRALIRDLKDKKVDGRFITTTSDKFRCRNHLSDAALSTPPSCPFAERFRLAQARLHLIRRPRRADCDDAPRVGERRRWLGEERFLHALNYCICCPAPKRSSSDVYRLLMHRTLGCIVAGALFVIPSMFILLALSYIYAAYGNVPVVAGVLSGFKPIVVAVVIEAMLKIGGRALKRRTHLVIAAAAFVAIYFFHLPFPLIVLAAGASVSSARA